MSIDKETLAELLKMAQQQPTQSTMGAQNALAGVSTAANIWSGYQADKAADKAAKMAQEAEAYARKKSEEETARRARRELKNETANDTANSMGYLDWLNKKYTPGVQ